VRLISAEGMQAPTIISESQSRRRRRNGSALALAVWVETKNLGQLLKGIVNGEGKLKDPAPLIGIKFDLEAEIQLTARIRVCGFTPSILLHDVN
jgi:hypothetical protein